MDGSPCSFFGLFPLCRHSRFGGSYIIQGLKSIGERDLVFHKGLHNVSMVPSGWLGGHCRVGGPQRVSISGGKAISVLGLRKLEM